jgi:hypothetical protein
MTREKLLQIARDEVESRQLLVHAQDIVDIGFTFFPCTFTKIKEPLNNTWSDMIALMEFKGWHQEHVLQKIESFLIWIARHAIVDMHYIKEYKAKLATLWYTPSSR